MLEVSYMEYWNHQLDICIMTNAIDRRLPACFAISVLFRGSLDIGVKLRGAQDTEIKARQTRRRSRTPSLTGRRSVAV